MAEGKKQKTKQDNDAGVAVPDEILTREEAEEKLSGTDNINNVLRLKRTGVKAYYFIGMMITIARSDWDNKGPDYFLQDYQCEDFDEYLKRIHEVSRAEAGRKILDFKFMDKYLALGLQRDAFFQIEDTDILRNIRVYFEESNDKATLERVQEIIQTAVNLGRAEFRKWVKGYVDDTKKGKDPSKISADPLTTTQIKSNSWERLKEWLKTEEKNAKGSTRREVLKEVRGKMDEIYAEVRDK